MWGCVNFRSDAIFLAGFPDQRHTQPAHNSFDSTTLKNRTNWEWNLAEDQSRPRPPLEGLIPALQMQLRAGQAFSEG